MQKMTEYMLEQYNVKQNRKLFSRYYFSKTKQCIFIKQKRKTLLGSCFWGNIIKSLHDSFWVREVMPVEELK